MEKDGRGKIGCAVAVGNNEKGQGVKLHWGN